MIFTEKDYQQVAEYLDGRPVELTTDQRELLGQFQADDGRVRLDVTVPAGALHRVNQRLAGAGHVAHHRAWWRWGSAAAAAMVGAFLLSSQLPSTSGSFGRPISADEYVRAFLHDEGGEFRDQTSSLSDRLLGYEMDWAMNTPWTVDISVGSDAENEAACEEPASEMPSQETWNEPDLIQ
jgi:hypothetical protein